MRILPVAAAVSLAVLAGMSARLHGAPPQAKSAEVPADAAKGQALFTQHCAICHYDQSVAEKMGPGLKGIYARGKFAGGKKVDDAAMMAWIEKGSKAMPGLKDALKPEEIRALIGYLKTL